MHNWAPAIFYTGIQPQCFRWAYFPSRRNTTTARKRCIPGTASIFRQSTFAQFQNKNPPGAHCKTANKSLEYSSFRRFPRAISPPAFCYGINSGCFSVAIPKIQIVTATGQCFRVINCGGIRWIGRLHWRGMPIDPKHIANIIVAGPRDARSR